MSSPRQGLEAVVIALATQCDGARMRDGRGFSRADAQEGARLSAMASSGIPWSVSDAMRALEMAARHPTQAAALMSGGDEKLERAMAAALRAGKLPPLTAVEDSTQPAYNLAALSSGGRNVNFWKMAWIADIGKLLGELHALSRLKHGDRRIRVVHKKDAEATVNGKRKRMERWEVPFNGTTLHSVTRIAAAHGFAVDPAVAAGPDQLVDRLRRSSKACWLRTEAKGATVAVFDLERADPAFSEAVKRDFRGKFSCAPADDWNWTLSWDASTREKAVSLAKGFGFAMDPAMLA